jgi:arylsulfatase A-like enzyme
MTECRDRAREAHRIDNLVIRLRGGIAGGTAAGLLLAFGESVFIMASVGPFWVTALFLLRAAVIYAAAGGVCGLLSALLLRALRIRPGSAAGSGAWVIHLALIFSGGLAAEAFFYALDVRAFRTLQNRWTGAALIFLACTLLASAAAGGLLWKIGAFLSSGPARRRRLAAAAAAAACLTGFFVLRILLSAPEGPAGKRPAAASGTKPPNIIILLVDSLRADHLSAYGYPLPTSPRIDRLAKEGILFRRCYATSNWTIPTHASIYSGMLPSVHGSFSAYGRWEPAFPTLAQILSAEGYRTASFHDNKLVGRAYDLDRGFQTSVGVDSEHKASLTLPRLWSLLRGRPSMSGPILRIADRWIGNGGPPDKPYFVFMNFLDTHAPYRPRKPYIDDFLRSLPDEPVREDLARGATGAAISDKRRADKLYRQLAPADWRWIARFYDSNIRAFDENVAGFLDGLDHRGLLKDTLIVFTSDHGEFLGESGTGGHYSTSLHDAGLRIPLILWWPGRLAPADVAVPVSQVDIFPTILSLAGISPKLPVPIQGESLLSPRENREILAEYWDETRERFSRAMYFGDHKLIVPSTGERRLVDPVRDPGEMDDLAARRPDLADALQARLEKYLASLPKGKPRFDEKERQRRLKLLKSLGYLSP